MSTGRRRRVPWSAYLYLAPALLVFAVFLLVPLAQTAQISLYRWDGLSPSRFVGLANYRQIATDGQLRAAFGHALVLIVFYAALPIALALVLTAAMSRARRLRGLTFFRTVLFLPQVVASTVVATTWVAIYAPDGVLNAALRAVGLQSVTRAWLGDFGTALPAVGLIGTWVSIGLCLVLFLAGVSQVPAELFEAARIDGAGPVREFFAVTLPGIRGQVAVAATLTTIAALKTFDLVYITTGGGPGDATATPAFQVYNRAFALGEVGSACAVGIVLMLVIAGVTLVVTRLQPRDPQR